MKNRYKYIHFVESTPMGFTKLEHPIHLCKNNRSKEELGYALYDEKWKQYVFSQSAEGVIFSADCLTDIIDYLNQLNTRSK